MKKSILLIALLAAVPAFGQVRTIPHATIKSIEARMTDLKSSLFLVDSLHKDYLNNEVFDIQDGARSDLFISGGSWLYNHYKALGEKYPRQCPECKTKAVEVLRLLDQEVQQAQEVEYRKIIKKAEDCFQQKDFLKAKEYYTRAVKFRPSDPYPKNKLAEVDSILAEQEKKAKE